MRVMVSPEWRIVTIRLTDIGSLVQMFPLKHNRCRELFVLFNRGIVIDTKYDRFQI